MVVANNNIKVNVVFNQVLSKENRIPILFLHGFTGSAKDWDFITTKLDDRFYPISVDLPGHGFTSTPNSLEYFLTDSYIKTINAVFENMNLEKAVILGYSMGGRTALQFANKYPEKIKALILESSTPGIENRKERESRIKTDSELAKKVLKDGIDKFIDDWMELPFFRSLKILEKSEYDKIVRTKKDNDIIGLANSLLGFSTGKMPSLWKELKKLNFPVLLIVGSLDRKFVRLNRMMDEEIQNSQLQIIQNTGHNTHLENKNEFTILVNNFLKTLE